jgi:hypothetical protein
MWAAAGKALRAAATSTTAHHNKPARKQIANPHKLKAGNELHSNPKKNTNRAIILHSLHSRRLHQHQLAPVPSDEKKRVGVIRHQMCMLPLPNPRHGDFS